MSEVSTSRRNVMRALATLSVASVPTLAVAAPMLVCLPDPAWEAALAAERAAADASELYYALHVAPAVQAHDAGTGSFTQVTDAEDVWGDYNSAHSDAMDKLIATPAPTMEDVVLKLRLGIKDWVFDGSEHSQNLIAIIADDIERLAGRAVA